MNEEDFREVQHYYELAKKFKLLTKDETVALFRLMERGNGAAREKIIESNLLLVLRIAQQLFDQYNGRVPLPDLIQEGNVGLIHAVDSFDIDQTEEFAPFAGHLIAQRVQMWIDASMETVRLPSYIGQTRRAVSRATKRLQEQLGRGPSVQEISDALNISEPMIRSVMKARVDVVSLQTETKDGMTIESLLPSREPSPVDATIDVMSREEVRRLLARLRDREKVVIELTYGFDDNDEHTLREIGAKLGLSYEMIRKIKNRAMRLLRTNFDLFIAANLH